MKLRKVYRGKPENVVIDTLLFNFGFLHILFYLLYFTTSLNLAYFYLKSSTCQLVIRRKNAFIENIKSLD